MSNLARLRERAGQNQYELAAALGVTQPFICHIEKGRKSPSSKLAIKMANHFNVSLDVILGRVEMPEARPSCQN